MPGKPSECIKMSKQTPKNSKIKHNTPSVLCWHSNFFESNKRQRISFRSQRWHVPYQNHHACCEKLWFVRSLYPNLPQIGQFFYHGMLMPLHDCMPSFMNFRRVLDLLEFKGISMFFRQSTVPRCLKFIPISCMGPKHATKDTYLIFQQVYMHWRMCM